MTSPNARRSSYARPERRPEARIERRASDPRKLADRYVWVVRGRLIATGRKRVFVSGGSDKRAVWREGKRLACGAMEPGTIVELRAKSAHGGIIERVQLIGATFRPRWRQAFET